MYRDMLFQNVIDCIEPLLQGQGFDLVELQVQPRKGRWLVRIFIDTEKGISLEDCHRLSLTLGQIFDADELIPAPYVLEVSSPGLDRSLRTARDFRRHQQRTVTIFLRTPLFDKVQYTGRVAAVADSHVVLHNPPDTPFEIPLSHVDHGRVELEFN